jgi:hypothetical protein
MRTDVKKGYTQFLQFIKLLIIMALAHAAKYQATIDAF